MVATTRIGKRLGEEASENKTYCIWKSNFHVVEQF